MPPIPPMVIPSAFSTVAFVLIVVAVVAMIIRGTHAAGATLDESPPTTRRYTLGTVVGLVVLLAATGAASASGVLEAPGTPPRVMIFLVGCNLVAVVFAFSRAGTRLVDGLPVVALVGFQAFRFPLELVLHRFFTEGMLPVQMTFLGRNFDILSGVLGLVLALWMSRRGVSRTLVWAYNLVGFGLLLNVGAIAVLSSPVPFRVFTNEPAVLLAFHFPYGWIVPACVAPALAGHLLVFRWLFRTREEA